MGDPRHPIPHCSICRRATARSPAWIQLQKQRVPVFISTIVCPGLNFNLPPQCLQIKGKLSYFLPLLLRSGLQSETSLEKSLEILHHVRELNPGHREDRQWGTFIFSLSYHGWLTTNIESLSEWSTWSTEVTAESATLTFHFSDWRVAILSRPCDRWFELYIHCI